MNRNLLALFLVLILLIITIDTKAQVTVNTSRQCIGDTVHFSITTALTIDSVRWKFGDIASGVNDSSKLVSPVHKYPAVNVYAVILTYYIGGIATQVNNNVQIYGLPTVELGADTTICQGANLTLDAGAGMAGYLWSGGQTTRTLLVNTDGRYKVVVRNVNNCLNTDSIDVTTTKPSIVLADASICTNYPKVLDAGEGFDSYLWSTGATSQTITASAAGNYWVRVTDSKGCVGRDTAVVSLTDAPNFTGAETAPENFLTLGFINVTVEGGSNPYSYTLFNSKGSVVDNSVSGNFANVAKGEYTISVTDNNGCADTIIVEVISIKQYVQPREAFSPNGDNINDEWQIKYIEIFPKTVIRVYDRWQRLVFESDGEYTPWDGTYNEEILPMGTYYYYIDQKNGNKPSVGFITLLR